MTPATAVAGFLAAARPITLPLEAPAGSESSALRLSPVVADPDVDGERRIEVGGAAHLGADEVAHLRHLGLGELQQELVRHLDGEPCAAPLFLQPAGDADHRDLDDVRVRALHDEVDRDALSEA